MKVAGLLLLTVLLGACGVAHSDSSPSGGLDVAMIEPEGEAQKYWPRWRGPSGQGLAVGEGYPDRWSDTENVLWKTALPGEGNSSPVVWGDVIFVTAAYDDGAKRSMLAVRRSDGKVLWETFVPSQAKPEKANRKNGYASGTPATDGEQVYAYFGNHGMMAADFDGNAVWHRDLGEMDPYHGSSCSPLIYEDKVIIYQDHRAPSGSFVEAFDRETGETVWRKQRKENVGWGSPVAIRAGDRDEIIVSSQHRVYSYNPENGEELWTCEGNLVEVTPTPAVGHGLVYCSSGRGGPTLAIEPGGSGDVTKTHVAWQTQKGSPFIPSPLLYGDYLFLVNDMMSIATCYEAKTGELMWQGRMGEARKESFSASPVGVDGKVFFTNDEGETFVLEAGPEFKILHVNRFNERTLASPALVDGKWYFRTAKHLYAIGHS